MNVCSMRRRSHCNCAPHSSSILCIVGRRTQCPWKGGATVCATDVQPPFDASSDVWKCQRPSGLVDMHLALQRLGSSDKSHGSGMVSFPPVRSRVEQLEHRVHGFQQGQRGQDLGSRSCRLCGQLTWTCITLTCVEVLSRVAWAPIASQGACCRMGFRSNSEDSQVSNSGWWGKMARGTCRPQAMKYSRQSRRQLTQARGFVICTRPEFMTHVR